MKPNFLVIGASKCGTSSLCALLGQHPDVFMSRPKEPNFFCYDHVYAKGWEWYESLFIKAAGKRAVGEGTTQYSQRLVFPQCLPRIVKHLPQARIIYTVRHPLHRMESLWIQMLEHRYAMPFTFAEALRSDVARFIESSNYLREIDAYRQYYPDDRILVLFFEDFRAHPERVLSDCFEFLGVDPTFKPRDADRPRNRSVEKMVEPPWLKRLRIWGGVRRGEGMRAGAA